MKDCLLTTQQIEDIGALFLNILLSTKHNGVIEKSSVSFNLVCKKLLRCNVPELSILPGKWLDVSDYQYTYNMNIATLFHDC